MKKHAGINLSVWQHQLWWQADGQVAASRSIERDPYNYYQPVALQSEWWAAIEVATNAIGREKRQKPPDRQRLGLLQDWVREAKRVVAALPDPEPASPRLVERWQPIPLVTAEEKKLATEVDNRRYGGRGMKTRAAKAWRKEYLDPPMRRGGERRPTR